MKRMRLIGDAAMIPPTIYYSKVGVELAKLVAKDQKMALPYVSPQPPLSPPKPPFPKIR